MAAWKELTRAGEDACPEAAGGRLQPVEGLRALIDAKAGKQAEQHPRVAMEALSRENFRQASITCFANVDPFRNLLSIRFR